MSKKKNTLKDLNDFLKQQAATLVSPDKLSNTIESDLKPAPQAPAESQAAPAAQLKEGITSLEVEPSSDEINSQKILESLIALQRKESESFNKNLCDIIIQSLSHQHTSPADKMLINTALYIKGGENWKEVIREYWKNK